MIDTTPAPWTPAQVALLVIRQRDYSPPLACPICGTELVPTAEGFVCLATDTVEQKWCYTADLEAEANRVRQSVA